MVRQGIVAAATLSLMAAKVGARTAVIAPATNASDTARAFGAREFVRQISLSPDATQLVAVVTLAGRATRAVVVPIAAPDKMHAVIASQGTKEQLDYCRWASNRQLICGVSLTRGSPGELLGFDRLVTLPADGSGGIKPLTARVGGEPDAPMQNGGHVIDWFGDAGGDSVLMTRQFVATHDSMGNLSGRSGIGVERVDPISLHRTTIEMPRQDAKEYITDGRGVVRIIGVRTRTTDGYDATHIDYQYRQPGSQKWLPLSRVTGDSQTESGFDPYAVDPALNVAYGFDAQDGRMALFKMALDGSGKRELVFARPDVDVSGLVRIGRQHRVVGVSFVTDRRQTEFFDPELKKLSKALSKALPGLPLVSFIDASADESKLLLWAGSDVDPGRYMLFDKKTRHLDTILAARPDLEERTLAPVKAIRFPAADGTQIPAYLTLPPGGPAKGAPAIVMPHGGPGDRDEWGFDWLAQFFAARGYVVLQPNFRGSTGYGSSWFQQNGFKSWKTAIGDVDDGGRWLVNEGIAAPDTLAIVGWSYGGYAALQSAVLDPALFKAIVAVAPVTDLGMLRREHENFNDYKLVDAFIGTGAHIRQGSPAQNAAQFSAPVLMFHGDMDQNVGIGESRLMASRLRGAHKAVELVEFPGLDHQLDDSEARTAMLEKMDAFLRTTMKLP